jgi:hypothetical protein
VTNVFNEVVLYSYGYLFVRFQIAIFLASVQAFSCCLMNFLVPRTGCGFGNRNMIARWGVQNSSYIIINGAKTVATMTTSRSRISAVDPSQRQLHYNAGIHRNNTSLPLHLIRKNGPVGRLRVIENDSGDSIRKL